MARIVRSPDALVGSFLSVAAGRRAVALGLALGCSALAGCFDVGSAMDEPADASTSEGDAGESTGGGATDDGEVVPGSTGGGGEGSTGDGDVGDDASTSGDDEGDGSTTGGDTEAGCLPPPPGLRAWWTGDGTLEDRAGGEDGSPVGDPTFAPGVSEDALHFDGVDDHVITPPGPDLDVGNGDFSVATWVQLDSLDAPSGTLSTETGDAALVSKILGLNEDGWRLLKQGNEDRFWFCFGQPDNGCRADGDATVQSTTVAEPGLWYHVLAMREGSTLAIYVDGVREAEQAMGEVVNSTDAPLLLGARDGGPEMDLGQAHLPGMLDEVMLFDRALTDEEAEALFDTPVCKD